MKALLSLFLAFQIAWAPAAQASSVYQESCKDLYAKRAKQLGAHAGLSSLVAGGSMTGGLVWQYAHAASVVGAGGVLTGAAGLAVGGIYGLIALAFVGFGWQLGSFIKWVKVNAIAKALFGAHGLRKQRALKRFHRKFSRKYKNVKLNIADFASLLRKGDESGVFCDGRLTNKMNSKRLKKRLAKKRHIFRYIRAQAQQL